MGSRKVIITAALTGGVHGKEANANLPEQPEEIIEQALESWKAGAAVVHCHARTPEGKPTTDISIFRRIYEGIRSASDVIINLSTGGGLGLSVEERLRSTELRPEICSLNMGLLNFYLRGEEHFFSNHRSDIEHFGRKMQELGIKPEMECYNIAMLEEAEHLIDKGLVSAPYMVNLVLNTPTQGGLRGTPRNLMDMVERLPQNCIFTVSSMGISQLPLTTMAMILGGHPRVGLEDNVHYRHGELAHSNAQLVERTVRLARELDLEPATPHEARKMLSLPLSGG